MSRLHVLPTLFPLVLVLGTLAACDDDTSGPLLDPAQVSIVNASEIDDLAVRRIGSQADLAVDLDAHEVTAACVEVPAGEHALVFTQNGLELALAAADFQAGTRYTAIFDASAGFRRGVILSDDEQASAGNNALRIINATASAGDVYVTPPGTDPAPAFRAIGNGPPLALSNDMPAYVHRATEHTRVRLYDPDVTEGDPRVDLTLTGLPTSRLATVVLTEPGASSFVVSPCP